MTKFRIYKVPLSLGGAFSNNARTLTPINNILIGPIGGDC